MKKISIVVPCYNEEENVVPMSEALVALFRGAGNGEPAPLRDYEYEILFIEIGRASCRERV